MNKFLFVAVLLLGGALALSYGSSGAQFVGPRVIAKVALVNQTTSVPSTNLIMVPKTGLYRASSYMTMTTPAQGGAYWVLDLNWTDSAGAESYQLSQLLEASVPPQDYGYGSGDPNCSMVFKAVAGTPISYYVYGSAGGTYEMSLVLERLE